MKHTKGPWHWDGSGYLWAYGEPNFEVANGTVYNKADANLIAAAPELLDAAILMLKNMPVVLDTKKQYEAYLALEKAVKQAIKKAEGRES